MRMGIPRISVLSKKDLAPDRVAEIYRWGKDSTAFEESLAKAKDGEEYTMDSQLYRSVKKLSQGVDLYPVSSTTFDGFIALTGEIARITRGGEEATE
jgi:hypothetical protein